MLDSKETSFINESMETKQSSFMIFIGVLTAILSLGCFYIGRKLTWMSPHFESLRGYIYATLILFVGLQLLGPYLYRNNLTEISRPFILQWITYTSLGFVSSLFFYFLSIELVALVLRYIVPGLHAKTEMEDMERRLFLGTSAVSFLTALIGTRTALSGPVIEKVQIPMKNLPHEFSGFKICQISDLHVGPTIDKDYAENVVNMVLGTQPDLIAITGDMIDGYPEVLRDHIAPLKRLTAPHGVYYCTGNHEYYWGIEAWLKEFNELGFHILNNQHHLIEKGDQKICIGGITDLRSHQHFPSHQADARAAFEGVPSDLIKILLAHQPASYSQALNAGVHLQLSGHTHGGQFFPWNLIVKLAQRFYKGLYYHESMWIYTNRGTGYWGPPQRFAVPSEITLIELVHPAQS